ncbi:MAG TPA: 4-(cytidine 5'-diphospho)-2-C-methyl-D-erythritol kinase [Vicinamibacterales bacterium]|jgi:4-diphosphocytidyl-2-C-methyl-D-erythritol kinase
MIVRAYAKINLTLRVLGTRTDGYHELRTIFQTVALHDLITMTPRPGPMTITCSDPAVPAGEANLAWKAAAALWQASGRRGEPRNVRIHIVKRIPMQAGLGGGSSDAAAVLGGLARLWRVRVSAAELGRLAATLGADVPFLLRGGTALGVDRGDRLYPLSPLPPTWVALVVPAFGVSTVEAYRWLDRASTPHASEPDSRPGRARGAGRQAPAGWPYPADELVNDLQPPVVARHPEIGAIVDRLRRSGASDAAMSGSGSAVFGLFGARAAAERAMRSCLRAGWQALVTRTMTPRQPR